MKKWTPEQDAAFLRWCDGLDCPESIRPAVLKKFKKLCLTVEEIERDMERKAIIMFNNARKA